MLGLAGHCQVAGGFMALENDCRFMVGVLVTVVEGSSDKISQHESTIQWYQWCFGVSKFDSWPMLNSSWLPYWSMIWDSQLVVCSIQEKIAWLQNYAIYISYMNTFEEITIHKPELSLLSCDSDGTKITLPRRWGSPRMKRPLSSWILRVTTKNSSRSRKGPCSERGRHDTW